MHQLVEASWNVMAHAQKPDFVFRRNERVHLNRRGRQFSRLLAAEVCASVVVMLDTPRSEVVWRVLATHSIRQFPLHFPSRATPWAITFPMEFNKKTLITRYTVQLWKKHTCSSCAFYTSKTKRHGYVARMVHEVQAWRSRKVKGRSHYEVLVQTRG